MNNNKEAMELMALELGCEVAELERLVKQQAYRVAYNAKPEVVAKRKMYNQKRNDEMKRVREALKAKPELAKELLG